MTFQGLKPPIMWVQLLILEQQFLKRQHGRNRYRHCDSHRITRSVLKRVGD